MSFGNSYGGGRTRMGTKVFLNVYDLSPSNDFLYPIGLGLHHSGVEILGVEYSFASGAGIFEGTPKEAPGARFREQLFLGVWEGSAADLRRVVAELRETENFGSEDYNLVRNNCNSFSNAFVWKLLERRIPAHVNRLADIGVCCSCLLPRDLLDNAPVGDPSSNNNNGSASSGFQAFPGTRNPTTSSPSNKKQVAPSIFSGAGHTLGGSNNNSNNQNSTTTNSMSGFGLFGRKSSAAKPAASPAEDAAQRREKARKAALARFEQTNRQQKQPASTATDEKSE
eukprot:CAMPEP_0194045602 /NCGR_PEP_ID=MMETSP0009_2-20130614/16886_1 /TAXON_ID=210454 /ORGANISM="Grammatophora oceanica, Strain CCMP 410" /LENGTH=281 /DNA_ID=CAMNT_0038690487 /DNA_START=6 /DNA_END=851 /DNA_ORIENTATION=+